MKSRCETIIEQYESLDEAKKSIEFDGRNQSDIKKFVSKSKSELQEKPNGMLFVKDSKGIEVTIFKEDTLTIEGGKLVITKPSYVGNKRTVVESLDEAKKPKTARDLPDSHLAFIKFDKDGNGNGIIKLFNNSSDKGFSIQTNGNLPKTHSMRSGISKAKELSDDQLKTISSEVMDYVNKVGTKTMKA